MEAQVHEHLGGESTGLAKYRQEYEKEFKGSWKIVGRGDLLKPVEEARFVFFGDFHALQQSQRVQLRLLKALKKANNVILAVEFFEARNQTFVDAYLEGKISEKELLRLTDWGQNWGFPWDHYRPLVRWALKKKVPILELIWNQIVVMLKHFIRDQFSAAKISELRSTPWEKDRSDFWGFALGFSALVISGL